MVSNPRNLYNSFAPENGWLEGVCLSFWETLFSGAMLVLGGVSTFCLVVFFWKRSGKGGEVLGDPFWGLKSE